MRVYVEFVRGYGLHGSEEIEYFIINDNLILVLMFLASVNLL